MSFDTCICPFSLCNKSTDLLLYCDVGNQEENSSAAAKQHLATQLRPSCSSSPSFSHFKTTFGLLDSTQAQKWGCDNCGMHPSENNFRCYWNLGISICMALTGLCAINVIILTSVEVVKLSYFMFFLLVKWLQLTEHSLTAHHHHQCEMGLLLCSRWNFTRTMWKCHPPSDGRGLILSRKAGIFPRHLLWHCETPRSSQLCSGPCSHSHPPSPPARPCQRISVLLCASRRTTAAAVVVGSVQEAWLLSSCFSSFLSFPLL